MNDNTSVRSVVLGRYIIDNAATVRDAAKYFGIGKSTVHKDGTEKLTDADPELAERVRKVLDYNLSVRHLRGGEATRQKSLRARKSDKEKNCCD